MRSPLATLLNKAPVPYVSRAGGISLPWYGRNNAEAQMRAMGSVGTLFAIVNRTTKAEARANWRLWRKAPSGLDEDRTEITSHAALDLWNQPNPFYTQAEFIETFQQHKLLTGEAWWLVAQNPRSPLPLELWPVRPDRMEPVPDPDEFLAGYLYKGPGGEQIPLGRGEVIFLKSPNPLDPYRGMGPVQSILVDLDSTRYSAEWNRNFFLNSAEPGGIIEYDTRLSDDEFNELRDRWQEQHQGVANAHRVAIIEQGRWVSRTFTMRDMQFAELREVSRETIREAFGFPRSMLGFTDEGNRAIAQAAEYMFSKWIVVPDLDAIKDALNTKLLPLYGPTTRNLEFDYDSPVMADREEEAKELTAKANAAKALIDAGGVPADVLEAVGLPEIEWLGARPVEPMPQPGVPGPVMARLDMHHHHHANGVSAHPVDVQAQPVSILALARDRARRALPAVRAQDEPPAEAEEGDLPDIEPVQQEWEQALEDLLDDWEDLTADQREELTRQVQAAVEAGDLEQLTELEVPTEEAEEILLAAMIALAASAAAQVVREAADQDVEIDPVTPPRRDLTEVARVTARLLAGQLAASAGTEALRVSVPGRSGEAEGERVAGLVQEHLESLTDARPRQYLGSALTSAQHGGRSATFKAAEEGEDGRALPSVAYYAQEMNDTNTCLAPDVQVTTRAGQVYAKDITLDDELLTHAGRWVKPSAIVVSQVEEKLYRVRLADGRSFRLTSDHPLLVRTSDGFAWREAGQLTAGDFVVDQSTFESGREVSGLDVVLGQTPDGVAAVDQVGGLPTIDMGSQRVPVGPVGFDDERLPDDEIDHPRADLSFGAVTVAETFEGLADSAFDAGLSSADPVAADGAKPAERRAPRNGTELAGALLAGDEDRRTAAGLGAVRSVRGPGMSERSSAALAGGIAATVGHAASTRAVVVPVRSGDGNTKLGVAAGADLRDAVLTRTDLGQQVRIGELALVRTVDGALPADPGPADLAHRRRSVVRTATAPGSTHGAWLAQRPSFDGVSAFNTRLIHNLIVLVEVSEVTGEPYVGEVFDFTIPGDETFWAEGVLVHNCRYCREVDRRWLGNTFTEALAEYPNGGYIRCEGGTRCRGMVVAVWRGGADRKGWLEREPAP